jgi:hypothetical protein
VRGTYPRFAATGDAVEPGETAVNVSFHELKPGVVIGVVGPRHILPEMLQKFQRFVNLSLIDIQPD